jgi:hypothetical protein
MSNNTDFFGQYKVKDAEETMVLGVGQPSPYNMDLKVVLIVFEVS